MGILEASLAEQRAIRAGIAVETIGAQREMNRRRGQSRGLGCQDAACEIRRLAIEDSPAEALADSESAPDPFVDNGVDPLTGFAPQPKAAVGEAFAEILRRAAVE